MIVLKYNSEIISDFINKLLSKCIHYIVDDERINNVMEFLDYLGRL